MESNIDELRERLSSIDLKYYNKLDDKAKNVNDGIVKEVARDALKKAEESFQKGTPEDAMFGVMYRNIAKVLLETDRRIFLT